MSTLSEHLNELAKSIFNTSFHLFKIMVPIIILVKIVEELGGIKYIAIALEPLMELVGLPASMGLVWATTLLTSIYGGMIIFVSMADQESLTVAQVTVLGSMMLVAHALPIESRIIQKAGVRFLYITVLRIVTAIILGIILHQLFSIGHYLDQPNQAIWNPDLSNDDSLSAWVINQLNTFLQVFIIIAILMVFVKLLKVTGIENLIARALQPLLRLIGLGKDTTSISIIGVLLGIIYGGGLLINEAKSGNIDKKEVFGSLTLLAMLHSIIEDTILIMLLGAHISGVLFFRIFFAMIITSLLIHLVKRMSDKHLERYLVYPS